MYLMCVCSWQRLVKNTKLHTIYALRPTHAASSCGRTFGRADNVLLVNRVVA